MDNNYCDMELIKDTSFSGERPLFASHDLHLDNVTILEGESAIKKCSNIIATNCRFEGNYPFWHVHGFTIDKCYFAVGGRSALWYSDSLKMTDTVIDAPKMFNLDATQHFSFNYSSSVLGITKSDAASSAGLGRS